MYNDNKSEALCVDVETCWPGGPISVVGVYRPGTPRFMCQQFVRGQNLTKANLARVFLGCRLLITFNGKVADEGKIRKTYPGVLAPRLPNFDLHLFARNMYRKPCTLEALEKRFRIVRNGSLEKKRGDATRLWKQYAKSDFKDANALAELKVHNKDDTVNLYSLAERMVEYYAAHSPTAGRLWFR